jgi:hypothetical protein
MFHVFNIVGTCLSPYFPETSRFLLDPAPAAGVSCAFSFCLLMFRGSFSIVLMIGDTPSGKICRIRFGSFVAEGGLDLGLNCSTHCEEMIVFRNM